MTPSPYLLAALGDLPSPPSGPAGGGPSFFLSDTVSILAAVLGLVILIVLWAVFVRKREDRRYNTLKVPTQRDRERADNDGDNRHRRRRHRRREHRGRNPTLAETGGLPPVRSETPPPQP